MDRRTALPVGTELLFPGLLCRIEEEIGRGSNAIVYKGYYEDATIKGQNHHVLIKELFPYHDGGGIYRREDAPNIFCEAEAHDTWTMHEESFMRGNAIHLRILQRHPAEIGGNFNTYALNGTYYTILDFTGGRTMDPRENQILPSFRQLVRRVMGMLEALDVFHDMGFLHLDISPDNVLLINSGKRERVELIDYNSIVSLEEIRQNVPMYFSAKSGYSAPEVRMRSSQKFGPWTDLYAAAAVFYSSLMGRELNRMQMSGLKPIDASESSYLQDVPETVKSQVRQILQRGLAPLPQRRYQNVDGMMQDLQELLDRIDGVGVTHWALWEMGRGSIRERVYKNPAFHYLTDEKQLYPSLVDSGDQIGFAAILRGETHAVLTGSGGMGKTTFLLSCALAQSRAYRKDCPAVLYLSLYGYQPGDANFIHDSLLRRLRFKPETSSYADARHMLDQIFSKPLQTASGDWPSVCLLLDGYNETAEDREALKQEIQLLAGMEGVSLLLASRNELPEYPFPTWKMRPLEESAVRAELQRNGLLEPESEIVRALLQNPLMLSLFVKACGQSGEQLVIQTQEELIQAYLTTLVQKAVQDLAEGSPERCQIEAAAACVYPVIAQMETVRRGSVPNEALLRAMERLYEQLGRRWFFKMFPQWAGHSADIRGESDTAEVWYGRMVHELLWRRLGLLYRDENGAYQVVHQEFRDTIAPRGEAILRMLRKRKRMRLAVWMLGAAAVCAAAAMFLTPQARPYEAKAAVEVLKWGHAAFEAMDRQYGCMDELLDSEDPKAELYDFGQYAHMDAFERAKRDLQSDIFLLSIGGESHSAQTQMSAQAETLLETGERMPWNDVGFLGDVYAEMGEMTQERRTRYSDYADRLAVVFEKGTEEEYGQYRQAIREIVDADARISALYFHLVCQRTEQGMLTWEGTDEGEPYRGTYQLLAKSRGYGSELYEFIDESWLEETDEAMVSALNDAQQTQRTLRMALTRDRTYERLRSR